MIKIALDIMGGDLGVDATISGLSNYIAHSKENDVFFNLFGNKEMAEIAISKFPSIKNEYYRIYDTGNKSISSDEKPTVAVRKGRGTSMFEAISSVSSGESDAVVSSGNTGAYMALSKMLIGMIPGIDRPAIVSIIPNEKDRSVMLDLGANTDCSSEKLVQFAIMGQAVARVLLRIEDPKVGLLNIGTERSKGTDSLEEAYNVLEKLKNMNFIGFIEGTDITKGTSDVIVTDGFSGNISLKTMEATIKYLVYLLKKEIKSSILAKIGFLFCMRVFNSVKNAIDPRNHNGAPLVGLQKISIKSHGNSDYLGFSNAVSMAVNLAKSDFIKNIKESLEW